MTRTGQNYRNPRYRQYLLPDMLNAPANAVYISTTGSNTAPYDSWATAANDFVVAIGQATGTGGDKTFYLDDETHTFTGNIRERDIFDTADGHYRFISRSGDPRNCILSNNDDRMFRFDGNVQSNSFEFAGVGFTKSITVTDGSVGAPFIQIQNNCLDVKLTDCRFGDLTITNGVTSPFSLIRGQAANGASLVLDHVEFHDLTFNCVQDDGALVSVTTGTTLYWRNNSAAFNITWNKNRNANDCGLVCVEESVAHFDASNNYFSNVVVDNTDASTGGTNVTTNGCVNLENETQTTPSTIGNITFDAVVINGGTSRHWGVRTTGPLTLTGTLYAESCTSTAENATTARGTLFCHGQGTTEAARAAVVDGGGLVWAKDCTTEFGPAIYVGGGGVIDGLRAIGDNCTLDGGVVYSGGDGDCTIDALLCLSCQWRGVSDVDGLAFKGLVNTPAADNAAKAIIVRHLTAAQNTVDGAGTMYLVHVNGNEPTTFTLTTTFQNFILDDNGHTRDVWVEESQANTTHNVLTSALYIVGGVTDSGVSSLSETNTVTSGAFDLTALGKLESTSIGKYAGVSSASTIDVYGKNFVAAPSVGAVEYP